MNRYFLPKIVNLSLVLSALSIVGCGPQGMLVKPSTATASSVNSVTKSDEKPETIDLVDPKIKDIVQALIQSIIKDEQATRSKAMLRLLKIENSTDLLLSELGKAHSYFVFRAVFNAISDTAALAPSRITAAHTNTILDFVGRLVVDKSRQSEEQDSLLVFALYMASNHMNSDIKISQDRIVKDASLVLDLFLDKNQYVRNQASFLLKSLLKQTTHTPEQESFVARLQNIALDKQNPWKTRWGVADVLGTSGQNVGLAIRVLKDIIASRTGMEEIDAGADSISSLAYDVSSQDIKLDLQGRADAKKAFVEVLTYFNEAFSIEAGNLTIGIVSAKKRISHAIFVLDQLK